MPHKATRCSREGRVVWLGNIRLNLFAIQLRVPVIWNSKNRNIRIEKVISPVRLDVLKVSEIPLSMNRNTLPGIMKRISETVNVVRAITWEATPCL